MKREIKRRLIAISAAICMLAALPCSLSYGAQQTAATETTAETEAVAKNLPEDEVSTEDIAIFSPSCCVMDAQTGQVLYYKNANDRHYPASITKILTALLLIENTEAGEKIKFTEECWDGIDRWSDMNVAMEDDEELSREQALYCMMLVSANEVCNQAAIHVSGSVKDFAKMMTDRAKGLGATGSNFVTTNGLHDKIHYTTAYDMALISTEAIKNDVFRLVTGSVFYKVETEKRPEGFELYHKHRMLAATALHDNRCIGGKTGYTPQANNTLVTYMEDKGITMVCVMLDNSNGHVYADTATVCNYCFDKYDRESIDALAASEEGRAMNLAAGASSNPPTVSPETEKSPAESAKESEGEVSEAPAGDVEIPVLKEDETSSETASPSDGFADKTAEMFIRVFIDYLPYSIIAVAGSFILLTLVLVWLRGVLHRGIHRRRYKKLRKANRQQHIEEED